LTSPNTGRAIREIVRSWRELCGGTAKRDTSRRTLLAVSGGADSSAMVLALTAGVSKASDRFVIGHVVHDMRSASETAADLELVRELGAWVGVPVVSEHVRVREGSGNVESRARTKRYRKLSELAREAGCNAVATGHHADDVLETMLMRLIRGAGPRGLACVAPVRKLSEGVSLVRPLLMQTRAMCELICSTANWEWASDATNHDLSFARAKIRVQVLPVLRELRADGSKRAAASALIMRDVAKLLAVDASDLLEQGKFAAGYAWPRAVCRNVPGVVLGEALHMAFTRVSSDKHDRLSQRMLTSIIGAVRDARNDRRDFTLGAGASRLHVRVEALTVTIHHEA
jgi:tRNA(Ile)-lysidine synthase